MLTLHYTVRDTKTKPDALRFGGSLPAVFYGPKEPSTAVTISTIDFSKVWKNAGESSIIVLKGPKGEEHEALIHDVELHPVSDQPLHADFYVIEKGKKLTVEVPLKFIGVAPAVKDLGGTLVKVLHDVEVEALPKDLPHELSVDITSLATLDSQVLVKDIALPAGVEMITEGDEVVAAVSVTEEEVEEPAKSIEDIEVVGAKGKEEPAEGEDAASATAKTSEKK